MAVPISGTAYRYYKELLIPHTHTHTHTRIHGRTSTCAHTHASQVIVVPISPSLKPPLNICSKELLIPHTHTHTHTQTHTQTHADTRMHRRASTCAHTHASQVMVVPISEAAYDYSKELRVAIRKAGIHVDADCSDRKMQKKVRTSLNVCVYTALMAKCRRR